jgi:RNA polymerase sigma factor (TIGR02999 family)
VEFNSLHVDSNSVAFTRRSAVDAQIGSSLAVAGRNPMVAAGVWMEGRPGFENVDATMMDSTDVTQLLHRWREGDAAALDELTPVLYDELRRIASGQLARERRNHTLQSTEVVHEAFVRLIGTDVPWQDRAHFLAVAARTMRRLLVDHARARGREKRGGDLARVTLQPHDVRAEPRREEILTLDHALTALAERDRRAAKVVELHHFGGLSYDEVGEVVGVSPATVKRDLRVARAWLRRELTGAAGAA